MRRVQPSRFWVTGMVLLAFILTLAWRGAPVMGQSTGVQVVAGGLVNPRGFDWDARGTLYVALAGTNSAAMAVSPTAGSGASPMVPGGMNGLVVTVAGGCADPYTEALPSASRGGQDNGPVALAFLDDWLYLANNGGGASLGNPDYPSGVYVIDSNGGWAITADISSWLAANTPRERLVQGASDGNPVTMAATGEDLLVVEASTGQLLRVRIDGTIEPVADLTEGGDAPSALAVGTDGSVYVGYSSAPPYAAGAASVVQVTPDGDISEVWTGLTAISALAIGPDGTLYAAELGTGDAAQPPYVQPGTGKIVRQTGPDSHAVVAIGLEFPQAIAFGPDGALYVSVPGNGVGQPGGIIKLDLSVPQPMQVPARLLQSSPCTIVGGPVAPTPTPTAAPAPAAATPAGGADAAPASGDVSVNIVNFLYQPATISITAGSTVTWTNNDSVPHTVTAADSAFDSGNLNPGQSFTHTFTDAGDFAYTCQYHPNMQGTVTVS